MATPEKSKTDIREFLHRAIEKCELREHTKKKDIELIVEEIARLKLESKQRQEQLLAQVNEHSNQKQTSNLPPNSTVEEPRSSEESCSTNQPM
jgi:hypothetical protein